MTLLASTVSLEDLREGIERLERPEWVRAIELTEGPDADDDMALWAWIVLEPEFPPQEVVQPALAALRQRIREYLSSQVPGLWAYVRVRESGEGNR